MKKHYRKENDCLNCGAELQGKFCHTCGQENLHIKESFGHMLNHAISDYFHFDHQFFHTLNPLLFKPGKLTNEYMAGRRVQYLHPVKMYIFISLVYFVLVFRSDNKIVNIGPLSKPITKEQIANADSAIINNNTLNLQQKQALIAGLNDRLTAKSTQKRSRYFFNTDKNKDIRDTSYAQYLGSQQKLAANKRDDIFRRLIRKREYELSSNETDVKKLITEGIIHNTPKLMFLLLPLFALLLSITFWRNKKFYVEHLIYSFHFHCFLFLFLTVIMLAKMAIPASWDLNTYLNIFTALVIVWYFYQSLRAVYHRAAARTISKMIGLTLSYTLIFGICMLLLVIGVALFE